MTFIAMNLAPGLAFDEARHFRIERGHDLIRPLDQRHFESCKEARLLLQ